MQGIVGGQSIRFNPYIYAGANPTNYVDPNGEFFWFLVGAAALWTSGYIGHEYVLPHIADDNSIFTTGANVVGAFLGYDSVSYALNVLRDPSAGFGEKAVQATSAVFHAALGISFVQSLGNAAVNTYKAYRGAVPVTEQGLQQLAASQAKAVGRRLNIPSLPTPIVEVQQLAQGFNGFRSGVKISISNTLGRVGRLGTFRHEMTHFYQIFTASKYTEPVVRSLQQFSVWSTTGRKLTQFAKTPLYLLNLAELHAAAIGGNVGHTLATSLLVNIESVKDSVIRDFDEIFQNLAIPPAEE